MSDPKDIKGQNEIKSKNVTPEEAAARIENVKEGEMPGGTSKMSKADLKMWSQLVARSWSDESFKQRLIENPSSVLREYGIEVPAGHEIRVVENTENVHYLSLPAKPAADVTELNEEELAAVAGGWCILCYYCIKTYSDVWVPTYRDVWTA